MNLSFDAKYAWRRLRNTPTFSMTSIFIVAISLAIAILVFCMVYRYWLMPLDFQHSNQWYSVQSYDSESNLPNGPNSIDQYTYNQLQQNNINGVSEISAFSAESVVFNDGEISRSVFSTFIRPNILKILESKPLLGRNFGPADGLVGSEPTVILSYDSWQAYFGGNENIIGQQTRIDGGLKTIIGVMPDGFSFVFNAEFWLPMDDAVLTEPRANTDISPIVFLKNTDSLDATKAQLNELWGSLRIDYPSVYPDTQGLTLVPINITANAAGVPFYIVMAVVACILILFGAVNIGLLLSARAMERDRELAVRTAVGSSLWRNLSQCLWESGFIIACGWVLSLLLSLIVFALVNPLLQLSVEANGAVMPDRWLLQLDLPMILVSLLITVVIWLVSSLSPVIRSINKDVVQSLSSGSKGGQGQSHKAASFVVGCQTILACFLLIVSGTLVLALAEVINTDFGINTDNKVVGNVALTSSYATDKDREQYIEDFEFALKQHDSAYKLAIASDLPGSDKNLRHLQIEDYFSNDNATLPQQHHLTVSNSYFDLLNVSLLEGRLFDATDTKDSLAVTIVDEYFAQRYWPTQSAIGKRFQISPENSGPWVTIIGVTQHARATHQFIDDNSYWFYQPLSQHQPSNFWLITESLGNNANTVRHLQMAAGDVDPDIPVSNPGTLDSYFYGTLSGVDILSNLFIVVSIITLLLAVSGIFGILARTIINSTRDIGVRRALGSINRRIFRIYLGKGFSYLLVGSVFGGGLAILLNQTLFNQLMYSTQTYIYPVLISVVLSLGVCIGFASYIPVRKIINLEPGDALRYE